MIREIDATCTTDRWNFGHYCKRTPEHAIWLNRSRQMISSTREGLRDDIGRYVSPRGGAVAKGGRGPKGAPGHGGDGYGDRQALRPGRRPGGRILRHPGEARDRDRQAWQPVLQVPLSRQAGEPGGPHLGVNDPLRIFAAEWSLYSKRIRLRAKAETSTVRAADQAPRMPPEVVRPRTPTTGTTSPTSSKASKYPAEKLMLRRYPRSILGKNIRCPHISPAWSSISSIEQHGDLLQQDAGGAVEQPPQLQWGAGRTPLERYPRLHRGSWRGTTATTTSDAESRHSTAT